MLEQKLVRRDGTGDPSRYEAVVPDEPELKEEIMFRGKGFKSQFHGATSIMSMISMVHPPIPVSNNHVAGTDHHQGPRAAGVYAGGFNR
jgi:hypothetical protein